MRTLDKYAHHPGTMLYLIPECKIPETTKLIINKIRKLIKFIRIISDLHVDTYMVYLTDSYYCHRIKWGAITDITAMPNGAEGKTKTKMNGCPVSLKQSNTLDICKKLRQDKGM